MKSKLSLLAAIVFLLANCASPENSKETDGPLPAIDILEMAKKEARKEKKNIFIMWHASWCGYCKKMDTLMNDQSVKEYFDESFVIKHLVVKERKELKDLENPGATDMLAKYLGDKAGIPFWIILDKKGNLLADSYMRPEGVGMDEAGQNTGCPLMKEEVDHWISVLKKTTDISEEGLEKIYNKFLRK